MQAIHSSFQMALDLPSTIKRLSFKSSRLKDGTKESEAKDEVRSDSFLKSSLLWYLFYGVVFLSVSMFLKVLLVDLGMYARLMNVNQWISYLQGSKGVILLFNISTIAAIVSVPPLAVDVVMNLVAGAAFGTLKGTFIYVLGTTFGCCIAFQAIKLMCNPQTSVAGISRSGSGSGCLEQYTARARALSLAMKDNCTGLQITLLLRVSPITPLSVCTALLALTELRFGPYALGTLVGLIPASLPYCYLGSVGKDIHENGIPRSFADVFGYAVGALATVLVSYKIYQVSESMLQSVTPDKDLEENRVASKELLSPDSGEETNHLQSKSNR